MPKRKNPRKAAGEWIEAIQSRGRAKANPRKTEIVSVRLSPILRRKIQARADAKKTTLSGEISRCLEASIAEESAFGGRDLRDLALLMASHFAFSGQRVADLNIGPETSPTIWLKDRACFDQALVGVMNALWARRPERTAKADVELFEYLLRQFMSRWVDEGTLTFENWQRIIP